MDLVFSLIDSPKMKLIDNNNRIDFFTITSSMWDQKNVNLIAPTFMKQKKLD